MVPRKSSALRFPVQVRWCWRPWDCMEGVAFLRSRNEGHDPGPSAFLWSEITANPQLRSEDGQV